MTAYYNEIEPYAADWIENLIDAGLIPYGYVDRRSIRDVQPGDLRGFTQCHFFAGIGGWAYAARLAGWPDNREIWTGSCPCQPFSVAGKGRGEADDRHLWPDFYRLIDARRPACVLGEQVAGKAGLSWIDGVCANLESSAYAVRPIVIPACAVNAPHRRERLWFLAKSETERRDERRTEREAFGRELSVDRTRASHCESELADAPELAQRKPNNNNGAVAREWARYSVSRLSAGYSASELADANGGRAQHHGAPGNVAGATSQVEREAREQRRGSAFVDNSERIGTLGNAAFVERTERESQSGNVRKELATATGTSNGFWDRAEWLDCADGKQRRLEPGVALLAYGLPRDVAGMLAGFGNAIVPQIAAEILGAYLDEFPAY